MSARTWTIYSLTTGLFLPGHVLCDAESLNVPDGYAETEGAFDWKAQRVDLASSKVVDYIPPAPADDPLYTWVWHTDTKRWRQVPTLAAIKADKWTEIKRARDAAIDKPITTPAGKFDHDAAARDAIERAAARADRLSALAKDASIEWTLFDNTRITLSAAQIATLWEKSDKRTQDALKQARLLREQINSAADAAAVAAVVWT